MILNSCAYILLVVILVVIVVILNNSCDYDCLARMNSLADVTWTRFDNFVGPFSLFRMF